MATNEDVLLCADQFSNNTDDPELDAIKTKLKEDQEELEILNQPHDEIEMQINLTDPADTTTPLIMSIEDKVEADRRSVFVANVDYGATEEELRSHFHGCGFINQVTILCDKFDGHPKGCAYIEFREQASVSMAMTMDGTLFRERHIKVSFKRTNRPGMLTRGDYYGNMANNEEVIMCEDKLSDVENNNIDNPELEAIKVKLKEEELKKLLHTKHEKQLNTGSLPDSTAPFTMSIEDKVEADRRSVFVANVDYGATAEELQNHFNGCGFINRVTILCNPFDGHPKGCAYVEFSDQDSVSTAMTMDGTLFRDRQIKVSFKRTNRPGMSSTRGGFRGATRRGGAMWRPRRGAHFTPYPLNEHQSQLQEYYGIYGVMIPPPHGLDFVNVQTSTP